MLQRLLLSSIALVACRASRAPELGQASDPAAQAEQSEVAHEQIVQVVAGAESTCVRTRSGRVACIGEGMTYSESEPGLDTHEPQVIDVPPSKDISAGVGFACSLDRDGGRVRCWGSNEWRQLGRATPGKFDYWPLPVSDLQGAEAIDSLGEVTCARRGREAICWPGDEDQPTVRFDIAPEHADPRLLVMSRGDDESDLHAGPGELFYGGHTFERAPSLSSDGIDDRATHRPWRRDLGLTDDNRWCSVTRDGLSCAGAGFDGLPGMEVGRGHGCAPVDQGVQCWGENTAGQAPPELLPFGGRPASVAVGAEHSCVVTRTGNVSCWGSSGRGQIGLPPASNRAAQIVADDAAQAWAFPGATCYSTRSGEFRCAGNGEDYCAVPAFTTVREVDRVSAAFAGPTADPCAVSGDGSVWCGARGTWTKVISTRALGAGSAFTLLWLDDVYGDDPELCWLEDGRGQCARWEMRGSRLPSDPDRALGPREFPFGTRADLVAIQGIDGSLCALTSTGMLICATKTASDPPQWSPIAHELPDGPVVHLGTRAAVLEDGTAHRLSPDRDRAPGDRIVKTWRISPKEHRVPITLASDGCLLDRAGEITCGKEGPIGSGTHFESLTTSSTLFPTWEHGCAIDEKHNLWCWGDGGSGQLGDGQSVCSKTPRDLSAAFYGAFAEAR